MTSCLKAIWNWRCQSVVLRTAQLLCFSVLVAELVGQAAVVAWTYHYSTKAYSWNNSRAFCRSLYTDLVAIQNKHEIAYLNDAIPRYSSYYWIGIRKIGDNWTWVGTRKTLTPEAENWAEGEPNNRGSNQDCVEIYIKSPSAPGKWNDEPCGKRKRALCYTASCHNASCSERGECIETIGSHTCSCRPGFHGPECEHVRECGDLDLPPHVLMTCRNPLGGFSFKSQCSFHCAEGYVLDGPGRLECLASGNWTNKPPRCAAIACEPLQGPAHGSLDCPPAPAAFRYQASCSFRCVEGFVLRGASTVQCAGPRGWTAPPPLCQAVQCQDLPAPHKAQVNCSHPFGAFSYQSACSFSCEEGFLLVGASALQCLHTGRWSAAPPECQAITCTPLLSPQNGTMSCVRPLGDSRYNSTCQFTCEEGFSLSGPGRLDCAPSGHWTGSPPTCEAIKCPELFAPEQGSLACSDAHGEFSVSSTCHFSCNEGFELEGLSDAECTAAGRWTAPPPTCKGATVRVSLVTEAVEGVAPAPAPEVRCPALHPPEQGTMSCGPRPGPFGLNTTCYFRCKAGFTLVGYGALRCRPSGQWTAAAPTCRAVKCSELRLGEPVVMSCSSPWGNFSYGSVCSFHCPEGQSLNGSARTVCRENGHWETPVPTCQERPLTIQGALTYVGGAVASTVGLVTCGTLLALLRKRFRQNDDGKSPLSPHSHLGTYGVFTNAAFDPSS